MPIGIWYFTPIRTSITMYIERHHHQVWNISTYKILTFMVSTEKLIPTLIADVAILPTTVSTENVNSTFNIQNTIQNRLWNHKNDCVAR